MTFYCHGTCDRHAAKIGLRTKSLYGQGIKYCAVCRLPLECDAVRCPCCHAPMRTTSRNPETRKLLVHPRVK